MSVYLGLGSNQGNRRANLARAVGLLGKSGFQVERISPVVESPAMLPRKARPGWNRPFLNLAMRAHCRLRPAEALDAIKGIESALGRRPAPRWSPRPIDIDLLLWEGVEARTDLLILPHPGVATRPFVLTPLLHLDPSLRVPVSGEVATIQQLSRTVRSIPLWMGIVNITPDSFSEGGREFDMATLAMRLTCLRDEGVQLLDFGAESTRPGAVSIDPAREWRRLQPVLQRVRDFFSGDALRPLISIDTRHPATAACALEQGADLINDVGGLGDREMLAVVREHHCQAVATHSLTVPVQPEVELPEDRDPVAQLNAWLQHRRELWDAAGVDPDRVIFDPGIGFGKNRSQNLEILRRCAELKGSGQRLLIGHSRKSFMGVWTERPFAERDPETLGVSLALCERGADIIRVHDPVLHARAYRAWAHINT